ncbi:MAG: DUF1007 family protein [Parvibaculaceae bacterium]
MKFKKSIKARVAQCALFTCLIAGWGFAITPASAHPHVFIDMNADFGFTDPHTLSTLTIKWEFDEFYSAFAVQDFKKDASGNYKQADLDSVLKDNLDNLKDPEWHYFATLRQSGKMLAFGTAKPVSATYDKKSGRFTIIFILPLATPVTPSAAAPVLAQIYDPTFYISIDFVKDAPVTLSGAGKTGCTSGMKTPDAEKIWSNLPKSTFSGGDFSAGAGFGANFASTVTLSCPAK